MWYNCSIEMTPRAVNAGVVSERLRRTPTMSKYTPTQRIRIFWSKVDKSGGEDACWLWTAGLNADGYGQMQWHDRKLDRTHRIAYRLVKGNIPIGLQVLHHCDNPTCCNPKHLFLGTHIENMLDRKRKGRDPNISGEHNPRCVLSDVQVAEIRQLYAAGGISQVALAHDFGVSRSQVGNIVRGDQR